MSENEHNDSGLLPPTSILLPRIGSDSSPTGSISPNSSYPVIAPGRQRLAGISCVGLAKTQGAVQRGDDRDRGGAAAARPRPEERLFTHAEVHHRRR